MTALLASLLADFWKPLAAFGGLLLAGLAVYFKGNSDAKAKAELKDLRDANDIRKDGAIARAGADTAPDRLRQSDGFKRD